jgi:CheY-like chemotaxis protein
VNREVASARLRRAGHDVSATVDGSAALELWRAKEFDIGILDIQMPIIDGLGVATAIRAEEKSSGRRRTALLALTAMTQELDRARCEAAGFDAYLAKPVRVCHPTGHSRSRGSRRPPLRCPGLPSALGTVYPATGRDAVRRLRRKPQPGSPWRQRYALPHGVC